MSKSEPHLLVACEGPLAVLTLNRPESRNAMSEAMREGLTEATRVCETDPAVRAVLIRAEG